MSTYYELYSILCGDLNGKKIQKKRVICVCVCIYKYIYKTDSLCYTAETNITLSINYTPIKFNKEIEKNLLPKCELFSQLLSS